MTKHRAPKSIVRSTYESFESANQGENFNPSLGLEAYQNATKIKCEAPRLAL